MVKTKPVRTRYGLQTPRDIPLETPQTLDFAALVKNLEAQLDELRAKVRQAQQLASLGTAAATIAHEVNNFLTPIRSYAQASLESDDHALMRKALEVTLRHVEILGTMSDRVLEVSAAKSTEPRDCALRPVVNDAVQSLCRDLSKDSIRLRVTIDDSLQAHIDPLQLQQVLFNLFLNACSAMVEQRGGVLEISGRNEGPCVVLEVSDTGKGIDAELLPHIFEAYRSTKTAGPNGKKRCSGLGLALCRDLIEDNGGTISVASKPGAGTTFTMTLVPPSNAHTD